MYRNPFPLFKGLFIHCSLNCFEFTFVLSWKNFVCLPAIYHFVVWSGKVDKIFMLNIKAFFEDGYQGHTIHTQQQDLYLSFGCT